MSHTRASGPGATNPSFSSLAIAKATKLSVR